MPRPAPPPPPGACRPAGLLAAGLAAAAAAAVGRGVFGAFVAAPLPTLRGAARAQQWHLAARARVVNADTDDEWNEITDPYQAMNPREYEGDTSQSVFSHILPQKREAAERDVKVTDQRDLNELLRLSNPLRPTEQMQLKAITLDDGTRIEYPNLKDLKKLRPTELRPVIFTWKDRTKTQTRAPKQYDDIIQRLLNAGPAEMEDLVRANWKMFDRGFFFRLTELKEDTNDPRLKEKIGNLEKYALKLMEAAREEMRRSAPDQAKDAREILNSMLEGDGDTLLWPPTPEAYKRLASTVTSRATRNKYEDAWFEAVLEICERFGKKMEVQNRKEMLGMAQIAMQRLTTEWLRRDTLWEETDEGRFLFRLMSLSHEQWATQLQLEQAPLDSLKLRDELKIISETKIVALPMASKLQVYAAKYIQGLVEFIARKDKILGKDAPAPVEVVR